MTGMEHPVAILLRRYPVAFPISLGRSVLRFFGYCVAQSTFQSLERSDALHLVGLDHPGMTESLPSTLLTRNGWRRS